MTIWKLCFLNEPVNRADATGMRKEKLALEKLPSRQWGRSICSSAELTGLLDPNLSLARLTQPSATASYRPYRTGLRTTRKPKSGRHGLQCPPSFGYPYGGHEGVLWRSQILSPMLSRSKPLNGKHASAKQPAFKSLSSNHRLVHSCLETVSSSCASLPLLGSQQPYLSFLQVLSISLYPEQIAQIEKGAGGSLPNGPLPANLQSAGVTTLKLIALNENFEVAYFTSLLHNITEEVPGYGPDVYKGVTKDILVRTISAVINVSPSLKFMECTYY